MGATSRQRGLSAADLEPILGVTRRLAASVDVREMLTEVVHAAQRVLHAERCSVWLYDASSDELVLHISSDLADVRIPAGKGIVGSCARTRQIINVPDCYADARFDAAMDRQTNYRTRCLLSLPLIGHRDDLVGVIQVLNKIGGVFDADDEMLAETLSAQCAVALQRAQMTTALIGTERLRQELDLAREVQMNTLPPSMPALAGYQMHGVFRPADETGGDTYDLALIEQGLLIVLADATGHGLAPALHVTQMHAMLRMAFRMGADLETAFIQINNQLGQVLPDDRFITAFIGILDPVAHELRFHSAGQAPILLYEARQDACRHYPPTSFPLAALPLSKLRPAVRQQIAPGDILALISDGVYEYHDASGAQFGEARVADLLSRLKGCTPQEIADALLAEIATFAGSAPQEDDITMVLVKRAADAGREQASFARAIATLPELVEFTAGALQRLGIAPALLVTVDFVIEELFTNMVKYSRGGRPTVALEIVRIEGGVEVTLVDADVDAFDVSADVEVDVAAPIEDREPGGLGLHLVRRMVDSLNYQYNQQRRESRITFAKRQAPGPDAANSHTGKNDHVDN